MKPCCGTCDAFVPNKAANPPSGRPREGSCCAESPRLVQGAGIVPGSQLTPQGPQMVPVLQGAWPPTAADRWCRQWNQKKESEDDE